MLQINAATYYVDFASGSDSNSGLSPSKAWKRSPGDSAAAGFAGNTVLKPGDTVLFRGGVSYRGSICVNSSGNGGSAIIFKGDGWGTEKARIEGADVLHVNWTVSPSQPSAGGNPNFAKIYYASAPASCSNFLTGLYEDGDFLWYSQSPDLPDPFYYDNNNEYYQIPQGSNLVWQTRTSVTDTTRLTQADSGFWSGAHVATWIRGNLVAIKPVVSFDPATDTVYHEDLGGDPYTDRTSFYSMLNHVSLISRPGEYAYDPTQRRLYVWPRNSDNPSLHEYSMQVRDTAFTLPSRSHVTIEGFVIQHFAQAIYADSTSATGVTVRNNEISKFRSANKYVIFVNAGNSLVEGNQIIDCQRAVGILSSATGIVIRNNFVSRTSRQGIWFMGASRSEISNNVITDIRGSHANALSVYSGASDILVANNIISQANSPITYEDSGNITFFGNVVDGGDRSRPVSEWFGARGRIAFLNNTFVRNPDSTCIFVLTPGIAQYVIVNNILDGGGPSSSKHECNLFVGSPGWALASHEELRTNLSEVFVAPESGNWQPRPGSPAIDSGTNPSQYLPSAVFPDFNFLVDLNGNPRGASGVWDKGAYESQDARTSTPTPTPTPIKTATSALGTFNVSTNRVAVAANSSLSVRSTPRLGGAIPRTRP
ncbi:MAG TPA: right-handed parallel beta-helix repeat-containing protein [Terrimicrobiaceae bacterium]